MLFHFQIALCPAATANKVDASRPPTRCVLLGRTHYLRYVTIDRSIARTKLTLKRIAIDRSRRRRTRALIPRRAPRVSPARARPCRRRPTSHPARRWSTGGGPRGRCCGCPWSYGRDAAARRTTASPRAWRRATRPRAARNHRHTRPRGARRGPRSTREDDARNTPHVRLFFWTVVSATRREMAGILDAPRRAPIASLPLGDTTEW